MSAFSALRRAPLGKLRGEYRAQLLIKGSNRKRIREALQTRSPRVPTFSAGSSWTSTRSTYCI